MPLEFVTKEVVVRGKPHLYRIVPHPGAVVIVAERDGRIALLRQYRPAVDQYIWELPAGTIARAEDPGHCAVRELEEEIGFRPRRVERLGQLFACPGYSSEILYAFYATDLEPAEQHLDDGEDIDQVIWLEPDEVARRIAAGEIADSKTLACFYLYRSKFGR